MNSSDSSFRSDSSNLGKNSGESIVISDSSDGGDSSSSNCESCNNDRRDRCGINETLQ